MNAIPRWLRTHPRIGDGVLATAFLLLGARLLHFHTSSAISVPIVTIMAGSLFLRRRYPFGVFVAVAAAAFGQWLADVPAGPPDLAILVALYTVAAYCRDRRAVLIAGSVTVGGVVLAVLRWHGRHPPASMVVPLAITAVALALGDDRRTRRAYFSGLEERAARLESERDALTAVAAAAERARIARELHDIVAHSLSVMVAQADGASYTVTTDPARASQAMVIVADTGRSAMAEMRRLLGVLRPSAPTQDLSPQPGIAAISELVGQIRAAGLPVDLQLVGPTAPLPSGLELAAYRVVQEALTNTLKHSGPGASAAVCIEYDPAALVVRVTDDGAGIRKPSIEAGGQGLAGMRERTAMYGGTLHAAPESTGGFAVTARFPLHATANA